MTRAILTGLVIAAAVAFSAISVVRYSGERVLPAPHGVQHSLACGGTWTGSGQC